MGPSGTDVPVRTANRACIDGNEAAARIAYALSEVIAIYPITPASPMGELSDQWAASDQPNLWGSVPKVIEMQSEAGAAGAVHGALLKGASATTFTASQGLLLMLPNMFKIAGELTPCVIHVAARTVATHALSIFGDHSDVMAARPTGWAMLASTSVQEAQDMALVAHTATLEARIPFIHFFDGFRTSHEVTKIDLLEDDDIEALVDPEAVRAHRSRGLTPDAPVLRGSAQNPDVFFQAREAANPYYSAVPSIVQAKFDALAERTGRHYNLVDYHGAPDAESLVVIMGSGAGAVREAVDRMVAKGAKVGMVTVRLYRPFPTEAFAECLPPSVTRLAALDRDKEPGATGEPLYQDVVVALAEKDRATIRVTGGRYGLSSKEFTPAMVKGIFDELSKAAPKNHFTVGIYDDVSHTSIPTARDFATDKAATKALFYGLGSDGTVGASKGTVTIVAEATELAAQGYFVYDSKKSGSITESHLRFDPEEIRSTYLIEDAGFVSCSQFILLDRIDILKRAARHGTFLLNSEYGPDEVWDHLPHKVQRQIIDLDLRFYVIDAYQVARSLDMRGRINTIMQTCFFSLSKMLPQAHAIVAIKSFITKSYGKRDPAMVEKNFAAVELAITNMHKVTVPHKVLEPVELRSLPDLVPDFFKNVTAKMLAGDGDLLPVSALPADGTFPTATSQWEKRRIAEQVPVWDPDICIDCGHCVIVCPHSAVRMKAYEPELLGGAPASFQSKDFHAKEVSGLKLTVQVAPEDCTGCSVCVDVCPVISKSDAQHKAINMQSIGGVLEEERINFEFFSTIPEIDPTILDPSTVKGSQVRLPLFEYSGACAGCGETPYLKLLTQLFGDRMLVANATGCSSIYGGNLPTTPWAVDGDGRGPAWANSLFEDNAEFGLGMQLALEQQTDSARLLLRKLAGTVGEDLAGAILSADQSDDGGIARQRERVEQLRVALRNLDGNTGSDGARLLELADNLVTKAIWIVGGDGWAYDIGSAGLDHVLASGRNVNILILDTEVYSNTGGQASKATPRGAIAKFAARGKKTVKKDLGMIAAGYGDVYVAQVALGANYTQTIKAFQEASAWEGPSLVIAYGTCIAHGIEMATSMSHQKDAVKSGYWPLWRYKPGVEAHERPFHLDSKAPSIPLTDFVKTEARFTMGTRSDPEESERLLGLAQRDIDERWRLYEQLAGVERTLLP